MLRFLNLLAILALVGSAIYAYSIKYETIFRAEKIAGSNIRSRTSRTSIGMLKAEWAHSRVPSEYSLWPISSSICSPSALNQIVSPEALPDRGMRVDEIGRKLEALGLAEPTNTPHDGNTAGSVTPSNPSR